MNLLSNGMYRYNACRWIVVLAVSGGLSLSGCASKYGTQITNAVHYKDCYAPIQKLRDEEQEYQNTLIKGAIGGVVLGALTGLAARGDGKGAVVGALVGLGLGLGTAFTLAEYKQMNNDRERSLYLSKGMITDAVVLDRVSSSAAVASDCYNKQFDILLGKYKAGNISKETFQEKAVEIITGLNEIAAVTKKSNADADKQIAQYQEALRSLPPAQSNPEDNQSKTKQETKIASSKKQNKKDSKKDTTQNDSQPTQNISEATANNAKLLGQINANLKATKSGETVSRPVAEAEPDASTMPSITYISENLTAQQDRLVKVDKQVISTKEECIKLVEKEGVQLPDALKPKDLS